MDDTVTAQNYLRITEKYAVATLSWTEMRTTLRVFGFTSMNPPTLMHLNSKNYDNINLDLYKHVYLYYYLYNLLYNVHLLHVFDPFAREPPVSILSGGNMSLG